MTLIADGSARTAEQSGAFAKMDGDSVPSERYYSQQFADLERDKLWSRTWQPACRLEEIPKVGDYSEYNINDQSFLVVRVDETEVKAYYNHCRHRGNELGNGNGSYRSGKIVCSFHGWRWNLDGTNDLVFADHGFTPPCLDPERLRLREVKVATALGVVWINPDPDAPEFSEHLGGALKYWEPLKLDQMRVRWWRYMTIDANWKTVIEPFMEAYHVAQTHPEIAGHHGIDEWDQSVYIQGYNYRADGSGTMRYEPTGDGIPPAPFPGMDAIEYQVMSNEALHDGIDGATMQDWQLAIQKELFHDQGLRGFEYVAAFNERLYAEADERGMAIPKPEEGGAFGFGYIFPNTVITADYGNAFIQRVRPHGTDPEKAIVEWYAVALPEKDTKVKRPKRIGPLEYEDWGFVVQQDLSNIEKIQRGVKARTFTEAHFSERYEGMILHMHRTLEEYLERD